MMAARALCVAAWAAARNLRQEPAPDWRPGDPFAEAILRGHLVAAWRDGSRPRRTRHLRQRVEHDDSVRAVAGIALGVLIGAAAWLALFLLIWQVTR